MKPHELDDLTDAERDHAPRWALEWVGAGERCTPEQLAECEDIATHFAKALLTATAENERLEAENDKLRLLLAEACDIAKVLDVVANETHQAMLVRIDAIRTEAGL